MPPISRIRSAARSGASAAHHTIDAYLDEHIDSDYALVTVERADGHFTLVIDAAYLELACAAERENPALVEGLTLPRGTLRAVVAGWPDEWRSAGRQLVVHHSPDHIPHLRLAGPPSAVLFEDDDARI